MAAGVSIIMEHIAPVSAVLFLTRQMIGCCSIRRLPLHGSMFLYVLLIGLSSFEASMVTNEGSAMSLTHSSRHNPYGSGSSHQDDHQELTCPTNKCSCFRMPDKPNLIEIDCEVASVSVNTTYPMNLTALIRRFSPRHTGALEFRCALTDQPDDEKVESRLWDYAFKHLTQLEILSFVGCQFKLMSRLALSDLSLLRELHILEANFMTLDHTLVTYLPRLEQLEISNSGVTKMPSLCSLLLLKSLNVSGNLLQDVADAGVRCFGKPLRRLESLVLESNQISEIPSWMADVMPRLNFLFIANNRIGTPRNSPSPFRNMYTLEHLDLRNNAFTEFDNRYFEDLGNITALWLSGNIVGTLPRRLFSRMTNLLYLDISSMGLLDNGPDLSGIRQLHNLNISHNALTRFSGDFQHLEKLYLDHNSISELHIETYTSMFAIQQLDLSFNRIQEIPDFAFRNQDKLQYIDLKNNNISKIGYRSFGFLMNVKMMDLSHNTLSNIPPATFMSMQNIESLDLSNNYISTLDKDIFNHNIKLRYLNISHNALDSLPTLSTIRSLEIVDLSYNRIKMIPSQTFIGSQNVTHIYLNHNRLAILLDQAFEGCRKLEYLNLSYNSLNFVDNDLFSFTQKLKHIDLSHNNIAKFHSAFIGLKLLTKLDLSFNNFTEVVKGRFPHTVQDLDLSNNQISHVGEGTFKPMSKLERVDLRTNNLTSISLMSVEVAPNLLKDPSFLINDNHFKCDCKLGWLKDFLDKKLRTSVNLPDLNLRRGLWCQSMYKTFQPLNRIAREDFMCKYETMCEDSCVCCGWTTCYCEYKCPVGCTCLMGDNYLPVPDHQVLCNSVDLTRVPVSLRNGPETATLLRLDGNNIPTLVRHSFIAMKQVETIHLNHSQIVSVENNTFKDMKAVKTLYLNDNELTDIYSVTFKGLSSLRELHLENNNIFSIDSKALLLPKELVHVDLRGNQLETISIEDLTTFVNRSSEKADKAKLLLSNNPWICDVEFIKSFVNLINTFPNSFEDSLTIKCVANDSILNNDTNNPKITHTLAEFLQIVNEANSTKTNTPSNRMPSDTKLETYILIGVCVFLVFIIVVVILLYANRNLVQVVCFTKFGCRMFKLAKAPDDDRPYDAFISYSNKDEDFVIRQLAPRLENGEKKFRLCLHYRDIAVGACIAETIVRSVEASKRTILVVSDNYLDSEWCRFEFQTAHQQVLSERRNRVILILMHDLDQRKVDNNLKMYMRARTYLKYDDPWFWEKLIFAMPDIHYTLKRPEVHHDQRLLEPQHVPSPQELQYLAKTLGHLNFPQQAQHPQHLQSNTKMQTLAKHNDMYEIPVMETIPPYQLAGCGSPRQNFPPYRLCSHAGTVPRLPDHHTDCCTHTGTIQRSHGNHCDCCTAGNSTLVNHHRHSDFGGNASDTTSGYHDGSSCVHYEEVGPPAWSAQSTPMRQHFQPGVSHLPGLDGVPPPLPSLPREGFMPKDRLFPLQT